MNNIPIYNDEELICTLNGALLERQGITDITRLAELYIEKNDLEKVMKASDEPKVFVDEWHDIEYDIQEAWGFERSRKHHRFWEMPKCGCPKLDNIDMWPSGVYFMSGSCVLHGKGSK